jgi:sec-independent protein translocase protein TatA
MRALEPWHLIVLLGVVLVLFGGKRLPDAARGLGRSMRIFKSEVKQMNNDDDKNDGASSSKPGTTPPVEGRIVDPHQQGTAEKAAAEPRSPQA